MSSLAHGGANSAAICARGSAAASIAHRSTALVQDTLVLSRHVQQHGARDWAAPAAQLGVAPAHCALKWHVLQQLYQQGPLPSKSKRYTDWELCVLLVVSCFSTAKCLRGFCATVRSV